MQIVCTHGHRSGDHFSAARHRHPWRLQHRWQPGQHQQQAAAFLQRRLAARERRRACSVDNHIIGLATLREIFLRVVDDVAGAQRRHQRQVGRAAHAGHVGPEVPGQLYDGSAHRARRAVDEHAFPAREVCSAEKAQRRGAAEGQGSGFVKCQRGRLECHHPIFRHAFVLRMTPHGDIAERKNRVAHLEARDTLADRFNDSRQLRAQDGLPWPRHAECQTHEVPEASGRGKTSHPPVGGCDRGRHGSDQHFLVFGRGRWDVLYLKHIGRAIALIHNGLHVMSLMTMAVSRSRRTFTRCATPSARARNCPQPASTSCPALLRTLVSTWRLCR